MTSLFSKERIRCIWVITKKDLKIAMRFPKNFIAIQLINPLRLFVLFGLVYQSFFVITDNQTLGNWTRGNYVSVLLLGAIFYTVFTFTYYRFRTSFLYEKYWNTIQIFLAAPVSKLDFLIGSSLAQGIELSIPMLCYLTFLRLAYPISMFSILLILVCLYLMLFIALGFSFMQGAFCISNENYLFIFDYVYVILVFLSCFYYEDAAIPQVARFLVKINPIYHAIEIARGAIFHHLSRGQMLGSLIYLSLFSLAVPFLSAFFFRKVVRELGVRGF